MTTKSNLTGESIKYEIVKRFGSMTAWAQDFLTSAKSATGWAILAMHTINNKLYNVVCDKHAIDVLWMAEPLIVIDVYEHAFYVDYKNNTTIYIEKFLEHIDWGKIEKRFQRINA